jgi:hypothetical protein
MATFLDTTGVSYHLTKIVKEGQERLVLISPYLKLNERLKELLVDKDKLKIDIRIIYGKSELQPDESNWLKGLRSVRLSFCKNLHAKCYLNEREAIVTSMNLYDYSQVNNNEMGILVSRDQDGPLYAAIYDEVQRLIRTSAEVQISVETVTPKEMAPPVAKPSAASSKKAAEEGVCIRCQASIKVNPMVPYCRECYSSWNKAKDDTVKERFCHFCTEKHPVTKAKPSCYPCYKEHKATYDFPAA